MIAEMKELLPGFKEGFFETTDGVRIHYIEGGKGKPVIFIPGWLVTPCSYVYNIAAMAEGYHVFAIENRGTGESDKPDHGYRIHRLAKDVEDLMRARGLDRVTLAGHSMGCSVIWAFIDLFGQDRIEKLILCDQSPWLWSNPAESDASMREHCGHRGNPIGLYNGFSESVQKGFATFYADEYWPTAQATLANNTEQGDYTRQLEVRVREQNTYDFEKLARLIANHYMTDWRDIIRNISVPTLFLFGLDSHAVTRECIEWFGATVKGSKTVTFSKEEHGNHIMMANNPEKFNKAVMEFLAGDDR